MKVFIDGKYCEEQDAKVSVFDHGFLYGEGVYETLRTYRGEPFLFDRHMRRLRASASMLALTVPPTNEDIDRRFRDTMRAAGLGTAGREAYIRILVTRGIGELTYDPAACGEPSIVVITTFLISIFGATAFPNRSATSPGRLAMLSTARVVL